MAADAAAAAKAASADLVNDITGGFNDLGFGEKRLLIGILKDVAASATKTIKLAEDLKVDQVLITAAKETEKKATDAMRTTASAAKEALFMRALNTFEGNKKTFRGSAKASFLINSGFLKIE